MGSGVENLPAGTLIDEALAHPACQWPLNAYLTSHNLKAPQNMGPARQRGGRPGLQGTAHPCRYFLAPYCRCQ